jgi:hypothetical protein
MIEAARLIFLILTTVTSAAAAQTPSAGLAPPNPPTAAERAAKWRLLLHGRSLTGWRGLGYDTVPRRTGW